MQSYFFRILKHIKTCFTTWKSEMMDIFIVLFCYLIFSTFLKYGILGVSNSNNIFLSLQVLFIVSFFLFNWKFYWKNWKDFQDGKVLKVFFIFVGISVAWETVFLDYNYFLNTDYWVLKTFIILSFLGSLYKPYLLFFSLLFSSLVWRSLSIPFGFLLWTGIRPAYELLMLFIVFLIVKRFRDIKTYVFVLLALTLHASNYFVTGIAKLEVSPNYYDWVFSNKLSNLFVSSYLNGWIGFLSEELILSLAQFLDSIGVLLTAGTLIVQLGVLLLLYKKRISILLFLCIEILHLGIFLTSGIFFWVWIIVNIGFIYLIKNLSKDSLRLVYSKRSFLIFICIVLSSPLFYSPTALGWWDSRVNTIYDFYATSENGNRFKLNRNDFSPYDIIFTQNRFYYLNNERTISNTYGVIQRDEMLYSNLYRTLSNRVAKPLMGRESKHYANDSYEVFNYLEMARSISDIKEITRDYGLNYYDIEKKNKLRNFLEIYFHNYNQANRKNGFFKKLGSPFHIYDLSSSHMRVTEKIKKVEVYKTNTWWNKEDLKINRFDRLKVMEVNIP